MSKVEKVKKEEKESLDISQDDRRNMINGQLENAVKERERLTTLIYKCQGALELLDSMAGEKSND